MGADGMTLAVKTVCKIYGTEANPIKLFTAVIDKCLK